MICTWAAAAVMCVAAAQEPAREAERQPVRSAAPPIEGRIALRGFIYPLIVTTQDARGAASLTAKVVHRGAHGRLAWTAGGSFDRTTESGQVGPLIDIADRGARRPILSIAELSLRATIAPGVAIEAGRLHPQWAVTDGYSPAEAFLPKDLTDPFADARLPLWAVRAQTEHGALRAEVFHALVTTPWRLPLMTGRLSPAWYVDLYFKDADERPPARGFTLARTQLTIGAWDMSAWVRDGVRPAPVLDIDLDKDRLEPRGRVIDVQRHFADETAAGLGVSRAIEGWMLRGELAHLRSPDPNVGRALTWSVGVDRPARNGMFTVTLAGNAIDPPIDPLAMADRAFLPYFIATSTQAEDWGQWTVKWLATMRRVGGVLTTTVERTLTPEVSLMAGLDVPHGSRSSSPGAISRARRGHVTIQWRW